MDTYILSQAFLAFGLFLVVQIVLFRLVKQQSAPTWVIAAWGMAGGMLMVWGMVQGRLGAFQLLIAFVVYTQLCVLYIFLIFSVVEASITLRLLSEIVAAGKKGIRRVDLFRLYSKDRIIGRRLERFASTGEIRKVGAAYERTSITSVFVLREYVFTVLTFVFPPFS